MAEESAVIWDQTSSLSLNHPRETHTSPLIFHKKTEWYWCLLCSYCLGSSSHNDMSHQAIGCKPMQLSTVEVTVLVRWVSVHSPFSYFPSFAWYKKKIYNLLSFNARISSIMVVYLVTSHRRCLWIWKSLHRWLWNQNCCTEHSSVQRWQRMRWLLSDCLRCHSGSSMVP